MSSYLNGNYRLKTKKKSGSTRSRGKAKETSREEFERRALDRLGGSIAFVTLKDGFVWRGDDDDKAR